MTADRTLPLTRRPETAAGSPGDDDSASGGIVELGKGFLEVAKQAYHECHHGRDAVIETERRQNRSGQ